MPAKDYYPTLEPNNFYHIYNRGVNGTQLFYKKDNYYYFLEKYAQYLSAYLDTYAYCLLGNHFHLLVKVKDIELKKPSGLQDLICSFLKDDLPFGKRRMKPWNKNSVRQFLLFDG
jgi:hypothetical protein